MNTRRKFLFFLSGGKPAPKFTTEYQDVIDYATAQSYTLPSEPQQTAQNQLVLDLKAAGVWEKYKELHIWRTGQVGQGDFKSIDWKRLNTASYVSAPALAVTGIEGDGVSAYVDLNFDVASHFPSSDITFGCWSVNGTLGTKAQMGSLISGETFTQIVPSLQPSVPRFRFFVGGNDAGEAVDVGITENQDTELITLSKSGNEGVLRKNETQIGTYTRAALPPNSQSVFALARNLNGSPDLYSNDTLSITFHAELLTLAEITAMKTALDTYFASL